MSYIENSLGADERIVAVAKIHWWYGFYAWVILIAAAIVPIYVWANFHNKILRYAALIVLAAGAVQFLTKMAGKWSLEIGVTSQRIVRKSGLLSLHTDEMSLRNIEGIRIQQSLWGRMLGFGTVRVEGSGVDAVEICDIDNPVAFRASIETARSTTERK